METCKNWFKLGALLVAAWGLCGESAQATETRQLLTSERDGSMRSGSINYASGTSGFFTLGQGTGQEFRGLIAFDINPLGLTSANTIVNATLWLRLFRDPVPADSNTLVSVYRMNADWVEGNAGFTTGDSATMGATWRYPDKADTNIVWNTNGVLGGPEVAGTPSATVDIEASSNRFLLGPSGYWIPWDVTTDVQAFVDGTATNFGWLLVGETGAGEDYAQFTSRENATVGVRPRLYLEFIPEPGPAMLAVLGALLLTGRWLLAQGSEGKR